MSARSRKKQPRFCRRFSLEVFLRMLAETSRVLLLLLLPLQYCYILLPLCFRTTIEFVR